MKQIDIHTIIEQMGISTAQVEKWKAEQCVPSAMSLEAASLSQKSLAPSALAQFVSSASSVQPAFST